MKNIIGILSLQGDFARHEDILKRLGVETRLIRWPDELNDCDGLILPGGESTTFGKLLNETGLFKAIQRFGKKRPVMGTCAGLIMLATKVSNDHSPTLRLIPMTVERNGYGRQVDSFIDTIKVPEFNDKSDFEGIFIRAPKIQEIGGGVNPLAFHGQEIVMAGNENILGMTFHPELTQDGRIHAFFIKKYVERK